METVQIIIGVLVGVPLTIAALAAMICAASGITTIVCRYMCNVFENIADKVGVDWHDWDGWPF